MNELRLIILFTQHIPKFCSSQSFLYLKNLMLYVSSEIEMGQIFEFYQVINTILIAMYPIKRYLSLGEFLRVLLSKPQWLES